MPYTIPARISQRGQPIPEIIVDDEFKELVSGMAVSLNGSGYAMIKINSDRVRLHRHLWLLKYGSCPEFIDHINGNRLDNRTENLRPANKRLNNLNRHNKSSHTASTLPIGVSHVPFCIGKDGNKFPRSKPYMVRIKRDGKCFSLGYYATPEEAGAVHTAMKFMLTLVESALCL